MVNTGFKRNTGGYVSSSDLLPELDLVYAWLDERLCRSGGDLFYPSTLPSDYCNYTRRR